MILGKILDSLFEEQFNANESFLFGFSQGALLTFEFGARYEKVLRGYIALSGYIYDEQKLLKELNPEVAASSWLCTHGTQDRVLPFESSKAQIEYLQAGGFEIEFQAYEKDHSIDADELTQISLWIQRRL